MVVRLLGVGGGWGLKEAPRPAPFPSAGINKYMNANITKYGC